MRRKEFRWNEKSMLPLIELATRVSVPLGIAGSVAAGSAWLAKSRHQIEQNKSEISQVRNEMEKIERDQEELASKLGRIEGKMELVEKLIAGQD
jgi:septal ring factor EnvC (AmiA/AmiB activator)